MSAKLSAMRVMALHEMALAEGVPASVADDAMDDDDPKAALIELLTARAPQRPQPEPEPAEGGEAGHSAIAAALADGGAEEREAACVAIEAAVLRAAPSAAARDEESAALVIASANPIVRHVLCAASSRIGLEEWRRASLLLFEMTKIDMLSVCAELWRRDEHGVLAFFNVWTAPDSVLAEMVAKEPSEWGREDALTAALNMAAILPMWCVGAPLSSRSSLLFH